jgi:hypothetical protein
MARRVNNKSTKPKKTAAQKMGKIKHKKTVVDGITFDSKMESDYYIKCKDDLEAGVITNIELQPGYVLQEKFIKVNGEVIYGSAPEFNSIKRKTKAETIQAIKYIADFKLTYPDGSVRIVDTKGQATADFKIKRKLFEAVYPSLNLDVIIWDRDNKVWKDYDLYQKELRAKKNTTKLNKETA